tara:strand:+ start:578 stop:2083 length:1506 start_codon:yes stop_codon:yes gene_type:complete
MAAPKNLLKILTEFHPGGGKVFKDAAIKKAWDEVKKDGFKPNPKVRNNIVRKFSDYISRFEPFKDEPKGAKDAYENPGSLPDTEAEIETWINIAGQAVVDAMERGGATTTSRITAEIKQHTGAGDAATTLTGKTVADADFESFKKAFPDMMNQSWDKAAQPLLHKWLNDPKNAGYKQKVILQIKQKLRNYMVINWVDKQHKGAGRRPTFGLVPSAAERFGIDNPDLFQKYILMEPRPRKEVPEAVKKVYKEGGTFRTQNRKNVPKKFEYLHGQTISPEQAGEIPVELISSFSISYRLTPAGDAALAKLVVDITDKIYDILGKTFLPQATQFIYNQIRLAPNSHDQIKELLQMAKEFSDEFSDTPILIQTDVPKRKFGRITSKGTMRGNYQLGTSSTERKGQFISAAQLSAILQHRLTEIMPRRPEPQRPIPRYVTGALAQSFRVMANYRLNLITYFNSPPVSGYVDQLNTRGWLLDKGLVEPTIRQITQERFGRNFKVQRT